MKLEKIQNFLLLSLFFSIPFYTWDAFGWKGYVSVPRAIAFVYFFISILNFKNSFDIRIVKKYIYPLVFLLVWLFIRSMFASLRLTESNHIFNFSFAQFIVLSIIVINQLKNNFQLLKTGLIVFIFSSILLYMLFYFGIGTETIARRTTIFGDNANNIAIRTAVAAVITLSFAIDNQYKLYIRLLIFAIIPLLIAIIGETASRGGLVAFLLGSTIIILFKKYNKTLKFAILILIISSGSFFYNYLGRFEELLVRSTKLIEQGDDSRVELLMAYYPYMIKNPIFGYGENGYYQLSLSVFNEYRSPHNWFLYVFLTGGLISFIAFFKYIAIVFKETIFILKKTGNSLPLAIFIIYIFHILKSGNQLTEISFWIFMSIIIAWNLSIKNQCQTT